MLTIYKLIIASIVLHLVVFLLPFVLPADQASAL